MQAVLDHTETAADGITTFWLKPAGPLHYIAGQFTELRIPHAHPDERGEKRWFSLSSSPTESLLAITTKLAPQRSSSFKKALFSLQKGAKVQLTDPMGDFVLPKDKTIPLVFVAAGIGVAPMRSMVKYLQDKGETRSIQLIYGVHNSREFAFLADFSAYSGLEATYLAKRTRKEWRHEMGPLTAKRIFQVVSGSQGALIYLSGPEPLVEQLGYDLQKKYNVPASRIITDFFMGYTDV